MHNIFAEATLGLVDSQCRRAPNASTDFIDGKVKYAKNASADWIKDQSEVYIKKLIPYVVDRALELSGTKVARRAELMKIIEKSAQELKQKRDSAGRKKTEGVVLVLVGKEVPEGDLLEQFPQSRLEDLPDIQAAIANPKSMVGKRVLHTWSDQDQDTVFHGLVRKDALYSISYWGHEESMDDCVDYDIPVKQFVADIVYHDLEFESL